MLFPYTRALLAHNRQQKQEEPGMSKGNGGAVKSERVKMSESELDAKIRRGVKALRAGYLVEDLIARGFTDTQIKKVQREAGMGKHGR
jgi:hypothetical protein